MLSYDDGYIVIRPSIALDIDAMKDKLRAEDAQEALDEAGQTPEEALRTSFEQSTISLTVLLAGAPAAMFGINPHSLLGDRAVVWLLGTDELGKVKRQFLRLSRVYVDGFLKLYPLLYNVVPVTYKKTIRWLKWLGADVTKPVSYGPNKKDFVMITLRRKK